ncbi:MAG: Gfo/Idh/MocA family protein [Deferribacterales bacterium]
MKVLQIGCGSMGKRRIRNFQFHGVKDITVYDKREDRIKEAVERYGVTPAVSFNSINWDEVTHVSISTPPDLHMGYAIEAAKRNKHTFIEASVVDNRMDELMALKKNTDCVIAPSCTMRYDALVVKAKELIDSEALGEIIFANHYFGQYLPYWHPYEDIKDFYVSNYETGAAREIVPFDLVFLVWLLGRPSQITALKKNSGTLGVNIDDIYSVLMNTDKGCQLHLTIDVLSKVSYRDTRIIGSKGNIEIDFVKGELRYFSSDTGSWKIFRRDSMKTTVSSEEMYVLEIKAFLEASAGGAPFPYTLEEDEEILSYLYAAEQAFSESSIVRVKQ